MSSIMKMLMFTWLAIVSVNALADTEIERSNPYAMVEQVANKTLLVFIRILTQFRPILTILS